MGTDLSELTAAKDILIRAGVGTDLSEFVSPPRDKASGFKWIEYSGADHIIPYEHSLYHCLTSKQVSMILYEISVCIYTIGMCVCTCVILCVVMMLCDH